MKHSVTMRALLYFVCFVGIANTQAEGLEHIDLNNIEKRRESLLILQKLESDIRAEHLSHARKHPTFEPTIETWSIMLGLGTYYSTRSSNLVPRANLIEEQLLAGLSTAPDETIGSIYIALLDIARGARKAATEFFYRSMHKSLLSFSFFRKKASGSFSAVISALTKVVDEDTEILTRLAQKGRAPVRHHEPEPAFEHYYPPTVYLPMATTVGYTAPLPAQPTTRGRTSAKVAPMDTTPPRLSVEEQQRIALENLKRVINETGGSAARTAPKPIPAPKPAPTKHSIESDAIAAVIADVRSAPKARPTKSSSTPKVSVHAPVSVHVTVEASRRKRTPSPREDASRRYRAPSPSPREREKEVRINGDNFIIAKYSRSHGLVMYYPATEKKAIGSIHNPLELADDSPIKLMKLDYKYLARIFIGIQEFCEEIGLSFSRSATLDFLIRCRLKAGNLEHLKTQELVDRMKESIEHQVRKLSRR